MTTARAEKSAGKLVPAVGRAAGILDIVAKAPNTLSAAEIGRQLGLAKSSVHVLCATLTELNLLVRRPDQTYQLGPHVMRWANSFMEKSDVATEFVAIWDEGTRLPGSTITLSVLEDTEVVYVAARNSHLTPNYDFRIGMRLPAPFTATGKAILSYLSDFEVRRMFERGLPKPLTRHSVQDISRLLGELAAVRERGYSIDDQQVCEGMVCFGSAVLNSRNRPIAAIAVSLPKRDFPDAEVGDIVSNVQGIARKISARLGAEVDERNTGATYSHPIGGHRQ